VKQIRVGIVGTGAVANFMTAFMLFRPDLELVCVASRKLERAEQFARQYYIPHWTDDYSTMVSYDLDLVYIATLPDVHYEIGTYFMNHGIGVLCEKPLVFEKNQAEEMLLLASNKKVLFLENLVTAYLPAMKEIEKCLSLTGKVKKIELSIGNKHKPDQSRLFTDQQYGGVFCDLSCYVLYFLFHIMKEKPEHAKSQSVCYNENIDMETTLYLEYGDGAKAVCRMSIMDDTEGCAVITCENGVIRVENFGRGGKVYLCMNGKEELIYDPSYHFQGFEYVFDEMVTCCRESALESSYLNHRQIKEITDYMIDLLPMIKERL